MVRDTCGYCCFHLDAESQDFDHRCALFYQKLYFGARLLCVNLIFICILGNKDLEPICEESRYAQVGSLHFIFRARVMLFVFFIE